MTEKKAGQCVCPFCETEVGEESWPFCDICKVTVLCCPKCHKSLSREDRVCPHCGAAIKE